MNQITVTFTACTPAPSGGYNIQYRKKDSTDSYINAGDFASSPAVFNNSTYPDGTSIEGVIRAKTAAGLCTDVPFSATGTVAPPVTHALSIRMYSGASYWTSKTLACNQITALGAGSSIGYSVFVKDADWSTYTGGSPVDGYQSDGTTIFTDSSVGAGSTNYRVVSEDGGATAYPVMWQTDVNHYVSIKKLSCP